MEGLTNMENLMIPLMDMNQAIFRRDELVKFTKKIMTPNIDYGIIPGTKKNTLFKPGAEKLATFFGLSVSFEPVKIIEDWTGEKHGDEPFFHYHYRCLLHRGEVFMGEGIGSCNSRESKYRWRWVREDEIPFNVDPKTLMVKRSSVKEFEFAINKRETSGKYGKPIEYWDKFQLAIDSDDAIKGEKETFAGKSFPAWAIDTTLYRVPNEGIFDQVNTIDKIAQKRALISAILITVNASEFFTQDMEDFVTEKPPVNTNKDDFVVEVMPDRQPLPVSPSTSKGSSVAQPPLSNTPVSPMSASSGTKSNGDGSTQDFWAYQRENGIDKKKALDILGEFDDFGKALNEMKKLKDSSTDMAA